MAAVIGNLRRFVFASPRAFAGARHVLRRRRLISSLWNGLQYENEANNVGSIQAHRRAAYLALSLSMRAWRCARHALNGEKYVSAASSYLDGENRHGARRGLRRSRREQRRAAQLAYRTGGIVVMGGAPKHGANNRRFFAA